MALSRFTKTQLTVLGILSLSQFIFVCARSILAPFFPAEASRKDVSQTVAGLVFGAYSFSMFVSSPFMGILVGMIGPKSVLCGCLFIDGVCNVLFGLSDKIHSSVYFSVFCFVARILEGVGAAGYMVASYTFQAKIFPDDLGFAIGTGRIAMGVGLSIGPLLGGLLYDVGGYGLPFYVLGGFFVLFLVISLLFLPGSKFENVETRSFHNVLNLFKISPIIIVCLAIVMTMTFQSFIDPTLEPHLRKFHLTSTQLGFCFGIGAVAYSVVSPLLGILTDNFPQETMWVSLAVGLFFSAIAMVLIGPSTMIGIPNTFGVNLIGMVILGTAIAVASLPSYQMILYFAISKGYDDSPTTYGLAGGVWTAMYSLGQILGPVLGGTLSDQFGFSISAGIIAASSLLMATTVTLYFSCIHARPEKKVVDEQSFLLEK